MIPIIDTGHGYNTPGKQSEGFYTPNGKVVLKENSLNEAVGNKLSFLFWLHNKEHYFITNEWWDVPLSERCKRESSIAKRLKKQGDKTMFLSIHADAFHIKNKAKGGRFFYYSESGKQIAIQMTNYLRNNGYDLELRKSAKANFKVLRGTSSPAILFEMGFMTTKSDLDVMMADEFRNKTAKLLYEGICSLDL